jgi:RNA polymerase sigma factor (sigma-70 family)
MADQTDMDLLREFAARHNEAAFTALVERHLPMVYSVALRFVGNGPDAEDVTQAVFVILTRKIPQLRRRLTLTGWLYETTRLTARQCLRTRARRQTRDQEVYMQSTLDSAGTDTVWRQLGPHLEAAMSRLGEHDRTLLALRFYENKTGAEAAALLGIGEEAAHKRTARALDKLRQSFVKCGVSSTTAMLAGAISANSVQGAPVGLVVTISATAVKGVAVGAAVTSIVKGTLKIMTFAKIQLAIGISTAILLAGGVATVALPGDGNITKSFNAKAASNTLTVTFADSQIMPGWGLPAGAREARGSGNPKDFGALSNIVAVQIASLSVTWIDTNVFKTHEEVDNTLHRLLVAPPGTWMSGNFCTTYEQVFWQEILSYPSIVARVDYKGGKTGQLFLYGKGFYHFAYQDKSGKWWLGEWGELKRQ